jgi:uncharacterized protein (UPF0212 family)
MPVDKPIDNKCPVCGRELEAVKLDGYSALNGTWTLGSKICNGLFS